MLHVPYRGGAPAIQAIVQGDVHFSVISPLAALPHIQSGAVRVLAAGGLTRDPQFPDIPTVAETGFPGFEALQWVGILTTGGTPKPVIDRLNAEVNKALKDPATAERFKKLGVAVAGGSAAAFDKRIVSEFRNWTEVARETGIKAKGKP
jgi:tripartite-type tricarboxylate transporter receptor subunit TctC